MKKQQQPTTPTKNGIKKDFHPIFDILVANSIHVKNEIMFADIVAAMSVKSAESPVIADTSGNLVARQCAYYKRFYTCANIVRDKGDETVNECHIAEHALNWSYKGSVMPYPINSYSVEGYKNYLQRLAERKTLKEDEERIRMSLADADTTEQLESVKQQMKALKERVERTEEIKKSPVVGYATRQECIDALVAVGVDVRQ